MDKNNPYEVGQAIAALNAWGKVAAHNWALVPQTAEEPYIVFAGEEKAGKGADAVVGRLLLFPGMENFRNFALTRRMPDFGVWMSPLEFRHFELIALRDGRVELYVYAPGYVPQPPTEAERRFLAPLLYECYGMMMRLENEPELPLRFFKDQRAMFARKEMVEGVWQDGPLKMPPDRQVQFVEKVSLEKVKCELAAKLPVAQEEKWEADFVMIPSFHTTEARPRFLYVFAAVEATTGTRQVWIKMSVGGTDAALKALWEGHAARLLDAMLRLGRAPGELHVRSARVARFLRPLGMYVPFKLVQHSQLPALDAVLKKAIQTKTV